MKNAPKNPGRDQGSTVPPRTDKRDPSQPPVRRDQPQGQNDKQSNGRGQEPRREDELPLKEDRQPSARGAQKQTTVPREKGQTKANEKNAPSRDIDSDDEFSQEDEDMDEEMDDVDLTDEEADEE